MHVVTRNIDLLGRATGGLIFLNVEYRTTNLADAFRIKFQD